eukprot:10890749-Heterocapsa_arctica.AAC.1
MPGVSPGISTLDEDQIFCSGNQFGTPALPVEWGYFQPQKKGSTSTIPVGDLCASSVPFVIFVLFLVIF